MKCCCGNRSGTRKEGYTVTEIMMLMLPEVTATEEAEAESWREHSQSTAYMLHLSIEAASDEARQEERKVRIQVGPWRQVASFYQCLCVSLWSIYNGAIANPRVPRPSAATAETIHTEHNSMPMLSPKQRAQRHRLSARETHLRVASACCCVAPNVLCVLIEFDGRFGGCVHASRESGEIYIYFC